MGPQGRPLSLAQMVRRRRGYRSNPYAVWWGLNQTSRIAPQRAFGIDYNNTAILRFNGTKPDEHGFGGDALGTIMQTQPLGTAITNNIDRNYAGEPSANFALDDNEFFQLPRGGLAVALSCGDHWSRFWGWTYRFDAGGNGAGRSKNGVYPRLA